MTMKLPDNYPCTVTIGFSRGNGETSVGIEVTDALSGDVIADFRMTPEQFALALSSLAARPAVLERASTDNLGKKYQTKTEEVFVSDGDHTDRDKIGKKSVKPFEVDGWFCNSISDTSNHHRWISGKAPPAGKKGHWYRVTFGRYVEASGADLEKARKDNEERS